MPYSKIVFNILQKIEIKVYTQVITCCTDKQAEIQTPKLTRVTGVEKKSEWVECSPWQTTAA